MLLRFEHSTLFSDEKGTTVNQCLTGLSREMVLMSGTFFAALTKMTPVIRDNRRVLETWFNHENNEFANTIYSKILALERKGQIAIILNIHTSLKLLERGFHLGGNTTLSNTQAERNVFKAYSLLNQLDNDKDNGIFASLKDYGDDDKFPLLIMTQTFRYADISSFSYSEVFSEQFVKATLFFKFLHQSYPEILEAFLKYYDCKDWQQYLLKIFPLVANCTKNSHVTKATDIVVTRDSKFDENIKFIDKLSFVDEVEELNDYDFVSLRSKPLFRRTDDTYRVIYDLFVFEKVFNGIFFTLRSIPGLKGYNLKDIFTFQFSEKILLYEVLAKVFEYRTVRLSGEQLDNAGIVAPPDYYVRRKKQVFLFESKDIIFNAQLKESTSFEAYRAEIKKKLYFDDSSGKVKPKAVLQLIRNVRNLLAGTDGFEKNKRSVGRIYPIVVVHNRQLNVAGLNQLLKKWFREELVKLGDEGFHIKKVAQLTIINISTLIHYADSLSTSKYSISKLIEEYHRTTSMKTKPSARNYIELENKLVSKAKPFNVFIANKIKARGSSSLLTQHARSIFPKH